ncbi:MAG TPA: PAS domain S-box protein [Anaerolineales bacterium]|nr:PAS domain S-box protein [Anaerolineales bacterium]
MKSLFRPIFFFDPSISRSLQEWRELVLAALLRIVLLIWILSLIAGVNNVFKSYILEVDKTSNPLLQAGIVLSVYLLATFTLVLVTFGKKLPYNLRAWGLLFSVYIVGAIGLVFSSLSGDGRVILFAFIILAAVFFDLRYSVPAFAIGLATMVIVGYLQVNGILVIPPERQLISTDSSSWISGVVVFLTLNIAVLISITNLLRVLGTNLEKSQELLQREQRLSQILRTVTGINQLIVREQDPHQLLSEACILLVSGQGYSYAWAGLLESDQMTLKLAAQAGDKIDPALFNVRIDELNERGLACAANAIKSRSFFRVDPIKGEDDPCKGCPRRIDNPERVGVALPLLREDRVLGVLVVDHAVPEAVFEDEEIHLLQDLANDLSYALEKIEVNDRLQVYARHQGILNAITQVALETPSLEAMLQKLIENLEGMFGAEGCYFSLWNEETQQVEKFISSDIYKNILGTRPNLNPGEMTFTQSILENRQILVVDDIMNSPFISPRVASLFPVFSAVGLPLIANEKKLGALIFGFRESAPPLSGDDIALAEQTARQIALAMLKVRLDEDTRAKAAELERLYAAAQDMSSSLLDAPELLEKLAHHMTEALSVTSGNIMDINLVTATMQVVGEYWSAEASPREVHSDLGRVFQNEGYGSIIKSMLAGEVLIMHSDDEEMTPTEREQFAEYGICSMMFVPILAHGQLFGNIEIWESRRRREFSQADIRLAKAMAGHAASIIENAKLVNAVRVSETRYRNLVEQASDGIFLVNPEKMILDANPSGAAMLGYSIEELLAMSVDDVVIAGHSNLLIDELRMGRSMIVEQYVRCKDGSTLPVEISARMLPNGYFQGIVRDISERKQAEKALAEREAYFRALIENSAEGVAILDEEGVVRYIAPSDEKLTGYSANNVQGTSGFQYIHPQDLPGVMKIFKEGVATPGAVRTTEYRLRRMDGEWRYFEITGHNMLDDPHIHGVVVNYRDVTERKLAEQALQESRSRLEAIISSALNGIITIDESQHIILFNPSAERIFGYATSEVIGQPLSKLIPDRYHASHGVHVKDYAKSGISARQKGLLDSLFGKRANGEEFPMEAFISNSQVAGERFFTVIFQDITERRLAEDALRESERKFRALAGNIPSTVYQCKNDERYTVIYLNDSVEMLTGYPKEDFLEGGLSFVDLYHPEDAKQIPIPSFVGEDTSSSDLSFHISYRIRHRSGDWRWVDEWGVGVLDDRNAVQYLEGVMIDVTDRKNAEEELRRHAMELETLSVASSALRTAQNVSEMVPILARHALQAVGGTFASIFLLDSETQDFVSHGWYSVDPGVNFTLADESEVRHKPGTGITGRVALTGEIYITEDIQKDSVITILDGERERLMTVHGGISLPLRTQEKIIGVMHVWSSEPRIFNETDIRLLTALAENTSNAIHRAALFEQTLNHASELATAYDNTLAGWARALELRDELTEGHTRRVTELTIKLAQALNIPEAEIVHIRRGALLHDIGKMGIPDSILHKPGAFTAQERKIMQQHTQYAYDMLAAIPFLQAALDIPYCHHEHWDGAGYPRGLKGMEIPLAARIFSIVDVWDALTSDRPYREAWSKEKTRQYILERSGKQFDPQIVEAFFAFVAQSD